MMMKKFTFLFTVVLFICISCEKNEFDPDNPDVEIFVKQLKNGTYNCYKKGTNGENLWLLMPKFNQSHIPSLINFAGDTSHIAKYPTNPVSSRRPFPEGREYFILGECLLWTVEGIRNDHGYGSLDPVLIDIAKVESERYKGLKGNEILMVRDLYKDWWNNYKNTDWKNKNPLKETSYQWF
jgi:hypothetical protein